MGIKTDKQISKFKSRGRKEVYVDEVQMLKGQKHVSWYCVLWYIVRVMHRLTGGGHQEEDTGMEFRRPSSTLV